MTDVVKMTDWGVVHTNPDPYMPPELAGVSLVGIVTGHPRKPDGSRIRTSNIAKVEGRIITTESKTVYELGEPSEAYKIWLREHRPNWDPEQPFVMVP